MMKKQDDGKKQKTEGKSRQPGETAVGRLEHERVSTPVMSQTRG